MNPAFAGILVAVISLLGSIYAVYQNNKSNDRATDVEAFKAIVENLREENNQLRADNRANRAEIRELSIRVGVLEAENERLRSGGDRV